MSLHPCRIKPVPLTTSQVAQAAFPKGNLYLTMRDEIGTLYSDWDFATVFPTDGQPAICPWRLALVCVMQFTLRLIRPTSRRGGSQPYRLEICFIVRVD